MVIEDVMKEVKDLASKLEDSKKKEVDLSTRIEEYLKAQHDSKILPENGEDENTGPYSLYQAKFDNTPPVFSKAGDYVIPWSLKKQKQFTEFVKMVHAGDTKGIQKAFGDNPMTETTTAGGYLVPTMYEKEILRAEYFKSQMLPLVTILPMPASKVNWPSITANQAAVWGTINTALTTTKDTFGQVALSAEELLVGTAVPNILLEDSVAPVGPMLANQYAEAFAKKIDEEIIDGDATDTTNHRFDGWMHNATTGYSPGADASPTLAEEVTAANLMAEVAALEAVDPVLINGAVWVFHPSVWALIRALESTSPTLPLVGIDKDWSYNLLGYPVVRSPYVPHAETVSTTWGLFGNPKYIYFGDMYGMKIDSSKDALFGTRQTAFVAVQRCALSVPFATYLGNLKFGAAS